MVYIYRIELTIDIYPYNRHIQKLSDIFAPSSSLWPARATPPWPPWPVRDPCRDATRAPGAVFSTVSLTASSNPWIENEHEINRNPMYIYIYTAYIIIMIIIIIIIIIVINSEVCKITDIDLSGHGRNSYTGYRILPEERTAIWSGHSAISTPKKETI